MKCDFFRAKRSHSHLAMAMEYVHPEMEQLRLQQSRLNLT